jgi:glycosyltransferase involved in cell wall biosynthesis
MKGHTRITLVISTYNWVEALERVLDGVRLQTVLPDEVIIADDGSRTDTKDFIDHIRHAFPVPVNHVWHEDCGFRRTVILNKSIAKAKGDYIIEIDGDVVPERHFIQDHVDIMEKGYFVCGGRVMFQENGAVRLSHVVNLCRSRWLRKMVAAVEPKFSERHVRGCNLAFWRDDFIAINGYNEDIKGWGHEDREMVYRLLYRGVKERRLKFGGIVRHIYHEAPSMDSKSRNYDIQRDTIARCSTWCQNGISKYLQ